MKTFKNIVLATDFSKASLNAYHYAREIAGHFGATLTVVHAFEIPLDPIMPDYVVAMPSIADIEEAEFKGIHHTLYAASSDSFSSSEVSRAIDFAKYFVSAIHFVHVNAVFEDPKKDTRALFKQLLEEKAPRWVYTVDNVIADTVVEGINMYALDNDVDLIIAVTHHRSFWKNLIHHSISKELAWQSHLPILCLHTDDKEQPTA
jgi:nucleotide-binding universal stress UspA family protein